ncbi:hypothetical protein HPB48_014916 [Haemaphysalis longicornis]|uniref:Uncharacterized protein n=1 Tax=Haemaphysalis longicornis TaxID=44386 RepID=A0A9J6GLY9_HAELO|nr:hypothetical protein HPB48_014916 [Haemaphysalis longicornis]
MAAEEKTAAMTAATGQCSGRKGDKMATEKMAAMTTAAGRGPGRRQDMMAAEEKTAAMMTMETAAEAATASDKAKGGDGHPKGEES